MNFLNNLKSAVNNFGIQNTIPTSNLSTNVTSPISNVIGQSEIGRVIDISHVKYRLNEGFAEGGFSIIFIATELQSQKDVAIKRMLTPLNDKRKKSEIENEINVMKLIMGKSHHIVQFIGNSLMKDDHNFRMEYFIAMEYLPFGSIDQHLSNLQLTVVDTLKIFFQISSAVSVLHQLKIVHYDLKIQNILISKSAIVKLCDFGSCSTKTYDVNEEWTASERDMVEDELNERTTPMYRPPELVDLYLNYSIGPKLDVWCLGCILFNLTIGEHPFPDSSRLAIINGNYQLPSNCDKYLSLLIRKLLNNNPNDRPSIFDIMNILQTNHIKEIVHLQPGQTIDSIENYLRKIPIDNYNSTDVDYPLPSNNNPSSDSLFSHNNRQSSPPPPPPHQHQQQQQQIHHSENNFDDNNNSQQFNLFNLANKFTSTITENLKNVMDTSGASFNSSGHNAPVRDSHVTTSLYKINDNLFNLQSFILFNSAPDYQMKLDKTQSIINYQTNTTHMQKDMLERQCKEELNELMKIVDCEKLFVANIYTNHSCISIDENCINNSIKFQTYLLNESDDIPDFSKFLKIVMNLTRYQLKNNNSTIILTSAGIYSLITDCIVNLISAGILVFTQQFYSVEILMNHLIELRKRNSKLTFPISFNTLIRRFVDYLFKLKSPQFSSNQLIRLPTDTSGVALGVLHLRQIRIGGIPLMNKLQTGCKPYAVISQDFEEIDNSIASVTQFNYNDDNEIIIRFVNNVRLYGNITVAINHARMQFGRLIPMEICRIRFYTAFLPLKMDRVVEYSILAKDLDICRVPPQQIKEFTLLFDLNQNQQSFVTLSPDNSKKWVQAMKLQTNDINSNIRNIQNNFIGDFSHLYVNGTQPSNGMKEKELSAESSLLNLGSSRDEEESFQPKSECKTNEDEERLLELNDSLQNNDRNSAITLKNSSEQDMNDIFSFVTDSQPEQKKYNSNVDFDTLTFDIPNNLTKPQNTAPTKTSPPNDDLLNFFPDFTKSVNEIPTTNISEKRKTIPTAQPSPPIPPPPSQSRPQMKKTEKQKEDTSNNFFDNFNQWDFSLDNRNKKNEEKPKTLNDKKLENQSRGMSENDIKIMNWSQEKEKNIRALLCSLHEVLWDGEQRWKPITMGDLITVQQVKKFYRKAVLSVHPDKMIGSEHEELARGIFMQLNDSWAIFEEEGKQDLL
ncbi:hypothetical protein SNEBB_009696 [Seison nebaliae]|nr:hypothetical protein SNEBB_009696 [Seison nebaliae]